MRSHALKTLPQYFEAVVEGRKTFEVRKDDRGFAVGDLLVLREWDADAQRYTGRISVRRVTYVLAGYAAIAQGYVVLGLASIPHRADLAAALERDAAYERERGNHPQAADWEQLARDIRAEDPAVTDEQFHNLVLLALRRVEVRTIAAATGASVPSVERWAAGKNLPHPAVRQRFVDAIGVVIR